MYIPRADKRPDKKIIIFSGAGLAAHIKATGGHKGNPVWMD